MAEPRCLSCMNPVTSAMTRCPHCGSSVPCPPNPPDTLQPGYILNNRFLIGRAIGRGGYGITYIAYDRRLLAVRCIKEYFPKGYKRNPDMSPLVPPDMEADFKLHANRFLQEARIMSAMTERRVENVVSVMDQLYLNGTTYILMEYLDGCSMDEWLGYQQRGLGWREAKEAMMTVLKALQDIHALGYLHRDLSLSNIFRLQNGDVRLIDFGSAEPLDTAQNHPEQMWPSSKAWYSPPEQVNSSAQTPATDTYAAGVCLFKMLAGGWPVEKKPGEPLPLLRPLGITMPEAMDRLIARATNPDPRKRFQTAKAMMDELAQIDEKSEHVQTAAPSVPVGQGKGQGKNKGWIIGIIAAVVLIAAVAGFLISSGNKKQRIHQP